MTSPVIVSSALEGLTSVFGMGTGVSPPVSPPQRLNILNNYCDKNQIDNLERSSRTGD